MKNFIRQPLIRSRAGEFVIDVVFNETPYYSFDGQRKKKKRVQMRSHWK